MPDRHRSSAPEDYSGKFIIPPQGPAPVTDVFPAGVWLHLLETGIQAIQLFAISRGSPVTPSRTPGHGCRFPGMLLSSDMPSAVSALAPGVIAPWLA